MKIIKLLKPGMLTVLLLTGILRTACAQEYVSPTKAAETGKSPGVKVKLLSTNGQTKTYVLVFAHRDEVVSGLNEFAQKYNVKSAHFTGIGDAESAKIGWYDKDRKMFKVNVIGEPSEISSLIGNVAYYQGKPVVHAHINVATQDGIAHGGHLMEAYVGPTLEVIMTVEPGAMNKALDAESGAAVVSPDLKQ